MPYIPEVTRDKYDERVDAIAFTLNSLENNDMISGELNYILFRLAKVLCTPEVGGARNYARMSMVSGALSEAQAEFRRRILAPYEDEKIKTAGDVKL
jgi:hypothetical protein